MNDFHQTDPDNMHYEELAQGVKHFKEVEEGRETMCETVQEYAEKYGEQRAINTAITIVKNLIKNTNCTLEQALDAAGIQGEDRTHILEQL